MPKLSMMQKVARGSLLLALMANAGTSSAAMVSQTIFFNLSGFFQSQGVPVGLPTSTVDGAIAFTYDDSLLAIQQDSTANLPSVFVDAVSLTINNANAPGASQVYDESEVMISLRVDNGAFILRDTLGAIHGGEQGSDGFSFVFDQFNDLPNIAYLFGNYTVNTSLGLWFSSTGSVSAVLGNQVSPLPLPTPLVMLAAPLGLLALRRKSGVTN